MLNHSIYTAVLIVINIYQLFLLNFVAQIPMQYQFSKTAIETQQIGAFSRHIKMFGKHFFHIGFCHMILSNVCVLREKSLYF